MSINITSIIPGSTITNNKLPVASNASFSILHDIVQPISLSATDADGDVLTYSILTGPSHGTILGSGQNITYVPDSGFIGIDSFTFQANDGKGDSNIATVTITVKGIDEVANDGPSAGVVAVVISEDQSAYAVAYTRDVGGVTHCIVKHFSGSDFSTVKILEDTTEPIPGAQGGEIVSLEISADGKTIVAGGQYKKDGISNWLVKRYNSTDLNDQGVVDFHLDNYFESAVLDLALSKDGSFIIAVGQDANYGAKWIVKKYSGLNFSDKEIIETDHPKPGYTWTGSSAVAIAGDNSSFVIGGLGLINIFDVNVIVKRYSGVGFTTREVIEESPGIMINGIDINYDGSIIVTAEEGKDADAKSSFVVRRLQDLDGDGVYDSDILEASKGADDGESGIAFRVGMSSNGDVILVGGTSSASDSEKWIVKSSTGANHNTTKTVFSFDPGPGSKPEATGIDVSSDGLWYLSSGKNKLSTGDFVGYLKSGTITP